jgi:hypothetical protein
MKVFIVYAHPRFFDRVKAGEMIVLDASSRELESRESGWDARLRRAYEAGRHNFS